MTRQEQIEQLETQNRELRSTLDNIVKKIDKILDENISLRERNEAFAKRIETLEAMLTSNKSESDAASVAVSSEPTPVAPAAKLKVPFQALILSDSMLRHVGGDCPIKRRDPLNRPTSSRRPLIQDIKYPCSKSHPKLDIKKICVPGARAPRLYEEALRVSHEFSFEAVYVHVGTNSLCDTYNGDIVVELEQFLRALKKMFRCEIVFSFILPRITFGDRHNESRKLSRESVYQIEAIRYINQELLVFCNAE